MDVYVIVMPLLIYIQGVHVYHMTFDGIRSTKRLEFNSADVNSDLNGANCSLTGCYESDAFNIFTIPHQSCVIGKHNLA